MNRKLNMDIINKKESKIVTTKEALKDVVPFIDTEEIKKETVNDFCKGFEEFINNKIKEIRGVVDMEKSLEQQAKELREKMKNDLFDKYARKEYSLNELENILNKENDNEEKIDFYNCDLYNENEIKINQFGFIFKVEFVIEKAFDSDAIELDLEEFENGNNLPSLDLELTKAYIDYIHAI